MAINLGMDPKSKKYGFDYFDYARKSALKLMRLRKSVGRKLYPKAVVFDLLIDAYSPELAWGELAATFQGAKSEVDYSLAITAVENILQPYRNDIRMHVESIITPTFKTGGVPFYSMLEKARSASLGDSTKMEDLEFSYVCFSARYPVFVRWAALGLMGYDKVSAYMELVDGLFSDPETGRRFDDFLKCGFSDVAACFDASIAFSIGGGGPQFPSAYQQLPPLF